jgi:hypothetical protein
MDRVETAESSGIATQRQSLVCRLKARQAEIVQTALARSHGLSPGEQTAIHPQYMEGLRTAVEVAVDYGVASIECGDAATRSTPPPLLAQARLAASSAIPLNTVLRRYFAGFTLFGDFVLGEAVGSDVEPVVLRRLMRELALLFDGLIADVAHEHAKELAARLDTQDRRLAGRAQKLLDGELIDARSFDYDFDGFHLGAVAVGAKAENAVRTLASELDRHLLLVRPGDEVIWGWMGGQRQIRSSEIDEVIGSPFFDDVQLSLGELAHGSAGWRLTHRQAKAALPIAVRSKATVRYAGVALLACALQDDLLATSLREIYLRPLEQERDGGEAALHTLRAYFAAERNVSSAAARMGVSRRTVTNRLRTIEQRLGRTLADIGPELETTLRLGDLAQSHMPLIQDDDSLSPDRDEYGLAAVGRR